MSAPTISSTPPTEFEDDGAPGRDFGVRGPELGQVVDLLPGRRRSSGSSRATAGCRPAPTGRRGGRSSSRKLRNQPLMLSSHVGCIYATQTGPWRTTHAELAARSASSGRRRSIGTPRRCRTDVLPDRRTRRGGSIWIIGSIEKQACSQPEPLHAEPAGRRMSARWCRGAASAVAHPSGQVGSGRLRTCWNARPTPSALRSFQPVLALRIRTAIIGRLVARAV